jgi:Carboxypeptidase regulatory-like domain
MPNSSPQAPAPVPVPQAMPAGRGSLARTLADVLWFPLVLLFGFCLCYVLPFHAPAPHGIKVAVAGSINVTQLSAALQRQDPSGAFDLIPVQWGPQARQEVYDQSAQAAYVAWSQATLYTAKADGQDVQWAVIKAFKPIARKQNLSLSIVDLVPTVSGDSTSSAPFLMSFAWNIVPLFLGLMLTRTAALSLRAKLAVIVGMGAFASIAGFLITYWLGAVPGQALPILYGFLNFEAVALTVFGLASLTGAYIAAGVAVTLFVFLSIPSSGGAIPYQMVPTFFDWLHPVMPLGNLIDAMRSIFYFDGTNMIRPTLVLCAWIAIGAALITVSALLHRARQQPAPAPGPASSPDPPGRELPGPAAAAEPIILQAPIAYAGPAANGTDGFGHRPPMLFGRVTEATGAPIWAASITIIDTDGHQLMRTSTDPSGRYAIDSLPGDILTILLSPPGRTPLATRVMLTSDLPVRQDFVLPDAM